KIAAQSFSEADAAAGANFIIDIVKALKVQIAIIKLGAEREFAPEEPGFDERHDIILALSADLDAQAEFLPAAGEGRRMEEIEIALAELDETDDGIHRAEARAHREVAGVFLIHAHDQIFAGRRNIRRFRAGIHFFEVLQAFE